MIKATEVKRTIKEAGFPIKDIRVSCRVVGYDSSIRVTLLDLSLNLKAIKEAVAKAYESISHCAHSGDILEGGNTYVFVEYDEHLQEEAIEGKLEEATNIMAEKTSDSEGYVLYDLDNKRLFYYPGAKRASLKKDETSIGIYHINSPRDLAQALHLIETA